MNSQPADRRVSYSGWERKLWRKLEAQLGLQRCFPRCRRPDRPLLTDQNKYIQIQPEGNRLCQQQKGKLPRLHPSYCASAEPQISQAKGSFSGFTKVSQASGRPGARWCKPKPQRLRVISRWWNRSSLAELLISGDHDS